MDTHGPSLTLINTHRHSQTLTDTHGHSLTLTDTHGHSQTLYIHAPVNYGVVHLVLVFS